MRRIAAVTLLFMISLSLLQCGQKGGLTRPEAETATYSPR